MSLNAVMSAFAQVSVGQSPDSLVQLNGSTLLAVTGILGAVSGALGVVWKSDRDRTSTLIQDALEERDEARKERDFFRDEMFKAQDRLFQELSRSERVLAAAEEATKVAGRAVKAIR